MTTPRATPSSRASARVDGSAAPWRSVPERTPSRSWCSSCARRATAESRSRLTISSIPELAFI